MPKKPAFSFGEDPDELRRNAESVQADFKENSEGRANVNATPLEQKLTVRLPRDLVMEAHHAALTERAAGGELATVKALVERGLRLVLAELKK